MLAHLPFFYQPWNPRNKSTELVTKTKRIMILNEYDVKADHKYK